MTTEQTKRAAYRVLAEHDGLKPGVWVSQQLILARIARANPKAVVIPLYEALEELWLGDEVELDDSTSGETSFWRVKP